MIDFTGMRTQLTISLVLVVGAGLFLRSFPAGAVGRPGLRTRADRHPDDAGHSQRFTPSLTVLATTSTDPERTALALMSVGREVDPACGFSR